MTVLPNVASSGVGRSGMFGFSSGDHGTGGSSLVGVGVLVGR